MEGEELSDHVDGGVSPAAELFTTAPINALPVSAGVHSVTAGVCPVLALKLVAAPRAANSPVFVIPVTR
jgi:hypothetical protein